MTDFPPTVELRSEAARGCYSRDPDHPHCGRCGGDALIALVNLTPLVPTPGEGGFSATICDNCAQRVMDLLVNPHLLVTAATIDTATFTADVIVDGIGVSRIDAVDMLKTAADMLTTEETEVIRYDETGG